MESSETLKKMVRHWELNYTLVIFVM